MREIKAFRIGYSIRALTFREEERLQRGRAHVGCWGRRGEPLPRIVTVDATLIWLIQVDRHRAYLKLCVWGSRLLPRMPPSVKRRVKHTCANANTGLAWPSKDLFQ